MSVKQGTVGVDSTISSIDNFGGKAVQVVSKMQTPMNKFSSKLASIEEDYLGSDPSFFKVDKPMPRNSFKVPKNFRNSIGKSLAFEMKSKKMLSMNMSSI